MKKRITCLLIVFALIVALLPVGAYAAGFTDVEANSFYAQAVDWAVAEGITSGTSGTAFSPKLGCTRAQVVTFLWRYAGMPAPKTAALPFGDVPKDQYYAQAVLWAVERGITSGTSDTTFSPDKTCTRAQVVTFLYRYDGGAAVEPVGGFSDVPANQYFAEPVAWAVAEGITSGTGNGRFSPSDTCTRAHVVTFLYRYDQGAQDETWDGTSLLDIPRGELDEGEILDRMAPEISSILEPWTDAGGYQDHNDAQLEAAGQAVYAWAQKLQAAGIIDCCTYNEAGHTVGLFLPSGVGYVYIPNVRDSFSGDGAAFTVQSFEELSVLDAEVIGRIDAAQSLIRKRPEVYGSNLAALYVAAMVKQYRAVTSWHQTLSSLRRTLESLNNNGTRLILWRGHGNQFTTSSGENVAVFILRQKKTKELREQWRTDFQDERILLSGDHVAVSAQFFEKYMCHVNGGIFVSGACETGHDRNGDVGSYMAKVVIEKGFDTYVAPSGSIFTIYGDSLMGALVTNLCKTDKSDPYGRRYTLSQALTEAKREWGEHDIYGVSLGGFGNPNARLLPDWEEAYEKQILADALAYGSIVQLIDLDLDGIPELIIGYRPGSGSFSEAQSIYTFKDHKVKKLQISNAESFLLSMNGYKLYQNSATGACRIEGAYTLRAGMGNYTNGISLYSVAGESAAMQTMYTEVQSYNMTTQATATRYYSGKTQLSSKSAYDSALKSWRSGWKAVSGYAFVSKGFSSTPTSAQTQELIKEYNLQ